MSQAHNYNDDLIIIFVAYITDLHVAFTLFLFLKRFQSYFKQFKNIMEKKCASEVSQLKEIHYVSAFYNINHIFLKITIKMNMVADIKTFPCNSSCTCYRHE